ncbi:MAG: DNA-directed RNA polymerase subunit omega [Deltaproteobacteria bacterium]|nr:DNA-directed RNA polymerase subunit omega [Deltaproteobacteria bacterium]MBW2419490.1 DNA-directed RNA polymerase subunit omega [Deltaproteobacteria bacterium]
MARITIEDCIEQVPNRFKLVQMAAIRAKQLKKGANALVDSEENKAVVTALREIAAGVVKPDMSLVEIEVALSESVPGLAASEPEAPSETPADETPAE